jgi:hypothetical protein
MQFILLLSVVSIDNSKHVSALTIYLYFHGKKFVVAHEAKVVWLHTFDHYFGTFFL